MNALEYLKTKTFDMKKANLLNDLLDDLCDLHGVNATICSLKNKGFSDDEIIMLGFDRLDVLRACDDAEE